MSMIWKGVCPAVSNLIAGFSEYVKAPRLKLTGDERDRTVAIVEKTLKDLAAIGY
jgi:4-hydroxy-tetrahydrodipicolinate synthase